MISLHYIEQHFMCMFCFFCSLCSLYSIFFAKKVFLISKVQLPQLFGKKMIDYFFLKKLYMLTLNPSSDVISTSFLSNKRIICLFI